MKKFIILLLATMTCFGIANALATYQGIKGPLSKSLPKLYVKSAAEQMEPAHVTTYNDTKIFESRKFRTLRIQSLDTDLNITESEDEKIHFSYDVAQNTNKDATDEGSEKSYENIFSYNSLGDELFIEQVENLPKETFSNNFTKNHILECIHQIINSPGNNIQCSFGTSAKKSVPPLKATLLVPSYIKEVLIESKSGEYSIKNVSLENLNLSLGFGKIETKRLLADKLKIELASGSTLINDSILQNMSYEAASSSLSVIGGHIKNIETSTASGKQNLQVDIHSAKINTASGSVHINSPTLNELEYSSMSGDITIENTDYNNIVIEANTVSGQKEIPASVKKDKKPNPSMGLFQLTTVSGDIIIK